MTIVFSNYRLPEAQHHRVARAERRRQVTAQDEEELRPLCARVDRTVFLGVFLAGRRLATQVLLREVTFGTTGRRFPSELDTGDRHPDGARQMSGNQGVLHVLCLSFFHSSMCWRIQKIN